MELSINRYDIPNEINVNEEFEMDFPVHAEFLSCATIREVPVIYVKAPKTEEVVARSLIVIPLGGNIPALPDVSHTYIGKFTTEMGAYTFFLFEVTNDEQTSVDD